jgi:hypothetical protein
MMNYTRILRIATVIAAFILFTVSSCKKEADVIATIDNYTAESLINQANDQYTALNYTEGNDSMPYYATNDGMPELYTLTEADMDSAGYKRAFEEKRFFTCLKHQTLTDSQEHMLRRALRAYELCKHADMVAHKEAYAKLLLKTENARKEYTAQLKNGTITKAQFEAKMKDLKASFETGLKLIKDTYAKRLGACCELFVRKVKEILTNDQWKAFLDCYK